MIVSLFLGHTLVVAISRFCLLLMVIRFYSIWYLYLSIQMLRRHRILCVQMSRKISCHLLELLLHLIRAEWLYLELNRTYSLAIFSLRLPRHASQFILSSYLHFRSFLVSCSRKQEWSLERLCNMSGWLFGIFPNQRCPKFKSSLIFRPGWLYVFWSQCLIKC